MIRALRGLIGGAAIAVAAFLTPAAARAAPDLTVSGVMTGADHETYREVPFAVPAGVTAVTVEFEYTGRDQRSVIDLGLRDPERFRGWSGGNKARFTVAETYATPSYLPGPLPAGQWRLILGVPNMRPDARAEYTARITFDGGRGFTGFAAAPLRAGPGWYRGDMHLHSGHSDGSCPSRKGVRVPCPLFKTLDAAAARGLDFVAVTEHNATSHHQDLFELQPYYDDLLLIPGREITTFKGHANVWGVVSPLDFQLGSPRAPDLNHILDEVEQAGGLISLNHPGQPSGELCMGCGWTAQTDYARIPAIEAVNGGSLQLGGAEGPLSGIPFWEARLNQGLHVTGLGSSDNHDAARDPAAAGAVGVPTTVVYADALSQAAILAGVRSGRVFVDIAGTRDRILDVAATSGAAKAVMGGGLAAPAGAAVRLDIRVAAAGGGRIAVSGPAARLLRVDGEPALGADETRRLTWTSDGARGWIRVDVRGPDGALWLLGNPIYLN